MKRIILWGLVSIAFIYSAVSSINMDLPTKWIWIIIAIYSLFHLGSSIKKYQKKRNT